MRTLEMIDSGFGLEVWEESGKAALKERKKVLEWMRFSLICLLNGIMQIQLFLMRLYCDTEIT